MKHSLVKARFKRPTHSHGDKNQTLKALEVKSRRVTNHDTHSTSNDPELRHDISEVDKLAVKRWKEHQEH